MTAMAYLSSVLPCSLSALRCGTPHSIFDGHESLEQSQERWTWHFLYLLWSFYRCLCHVWAQCHLVNRMGEKNQKRTFSELGRI